MPMVLGSLGHVPGVQCHTVTSPLSLQLLLEGDDSAPGFPQCLEGRVWSGPTEALGVHGLSAEAQALLPLSTSPSPPGRGVKGVNSEMRALEPGPKLLRFHMPPAPKRQIKRPGEPGISASPL
jgi:hypothetical protein